MLFFFQAEDGIRDVAVTGVQTCALPISRRGAPPSARCTSTCRNDTPWLHPVPSALKHASLAAKRAASASALSARPAQSRSEERRVGKEGRSRWSPYH